MQPHPHKHRVKFNHFQGDKVDTLTSLHLDSCLESPDVHSFFHPRGSPTEAAGVTSPSAVLPMVQLYSEPDDRNISCLPSLLNVNELGTPWKNFEYEERVERQDISVL